MLFGADILYWTRHWSDLVFAECVFLNMHLSIDVLLFRERLQWVYQQLAFCTENDSFCVCGHLYWRISGCIQFHHCTQPSQSWLPWVFFVVVCTSIITISQLSNPWLLEFEGDGIQCLWETLCLSFHYPVLCQCFCFTLFFPAPFVWMPLGYVPPFYWLSCRMCFLSCIRRFSYGIIMVWEGDSSVA